MKDEIRHAGAIVEMDLFSTLVRVFDTGTPTTLSLQFFVQAEPPIPDDREHFAFEGIWIISPTCGGDFDISSGFPMSTSLRLTNLPLSKPILSENPRTFSQTISFVRS